MRTIQVTALAVTVCMIGCVVRRALVTSVGRMPDSAFATGAPITSSGTLRGEVLIDYCK